MFRFVAVVGGAGFLLFALSGSSVAQMDSTAGQISIGAVVGYGVGGHGDLNDTIDEFNDFFDDYMDYLEYDGDVVHSEFDNDQVSGNLVFGLRMEYGIMDNLVIGGEGLLLRGAGGFSYDYLCEDYYSYEVILEEGDAEYDVSGVVLSVYGAFAARPAQLPLALRVGGGLGLVGGRFELAIDSYWESDDWPYTQQLSQSVEATGIGLALNVFTGLEYKIEDLVYVTADVGYRFARVSRLIVGDTTQEPWSPHGVEEGETLLWDDYRFSTEEGDEVGLDFGGVYLTLGVGVFF